jgi:hypothetical protein
MKSARFAPPYSVVLVTDPSNGEIPHSSSMREALIASTQSCIAVGCMAEVNGETEFTLGLSQDVDPGMPPAFEGVLKTPSRRIVVRSVLGQVILDAAVSGQKTKVRVWVNDRKEPDRVVIGIV